MPALGDATMTRVGRVVVPEDADGFLAEHPRMVGDLHRCGVGSADTAVTSADSGAIRTTDTRFGFPVVGTLELAAGYFGVGLITDNDQPLRWHGHSGGAGEGVVFPERTGIPVRLPGDAVVRTVSAPMEALHHAADELGVPLTRPTPGVAGGAPMAALERALRSHYRSVHSGTHTTDIDDEVLHSLVHLLARHRPDRTRRRSTESVRIASSVLELLETRGEWTCTTLTMCRTAHVSERRLQLAFRDLFGVTPQAFLRSRALTACRSALVDAASDDKVSRIALDHGFRHLPRFASAYREAFGELPSETLQQVCGREPNRRHQVATVRGGTPEHRAPRG